MKIYIYISFVLFIALASCQKVVDADNLLDSEEKVYIVGFLSPNDTVFRVNVSKALPSIGTPLPVQDYGAYREAFLIKNASVRISDEAGNQTNLVYSDSLETYLADAATLPIESEKQYFLEVTVNDKTYNASCRIPKKVNEIVYEIFPIQYEIGTDYAGGKLSFQDFQEDNNFYALGAGTKLTYTFQDEEQETSNQIFFGIDEFITDNLNNGGILSGQGSNVQFFGEELEVIKVEVTAQVAHLEEIIFQHMQSAELNYEADGNPFVEYSIAPNNILDEGAVGVFAGYQITEKVIEVEY